MNRNSFIRKSIGLTSLALISANAMAGAANTDMNEETDWEDFSVSFHHDKGVIDLRSNGGSPIPKKVLEMTVSDCSFIQAVPTLRNGGGKAELRDRIAKEISASPDEIAIMRNTTEALNNAIMGFPFKKGDEVIASVHEYDSMLGSLYQRRLRDGITVKQIDIPYRPASTEEILDIWKKSITENTKMFLISHMVWISGQIYPVKEICALARQHNIGTIIDAAHSFSHISIDVKAMGCDYLGTSLHKWCAAPLGTGFLYIRKEMISSTYPLMGAYQFLPDDENIEKFEEYGTVTPVFKPAMLSLDIWKSLGAERKTDRMQHLKSYCSEQVRRIPGVQIISNTDEANSCGFFYFMIKDKSAKKIKDELWQKYRINVQAIEGYKNHYVDYKGINAIGVATPVFITKKQIDYFVSVLRKVAVS